MNPGVDEELLQSVAFSSERAERITGVSSRQLEDWDRKGFFPASYVGASRQASDAPRLYSFRQLVELRVLAKLRNEHRIPLQQLRKLKVWIDEAGKNWATLRFGVQGDPGQKKRLVFEDPETGKLLATKPFGQAIIPYDLAPIVEDTRARLIALRQRDPADVGEISKQRTVQSGRPVIKGTRLLVSTIVAHREAGASVREIADRFPGITERDVRAALAYAKAHAA